MSVLLAALLVVGVFNTCLLFGTLSVAGLLRREYSSNTAALVDGHNHVIDRMQTLEESVGHALDCLVTVDANAIGEEEEEQ